MLLLLCINGSSGVADGRLRSERPARLAQRGRDLRRGAGAWSRSHSLGGDSTVEPLMVHSVVDSTGLHRYLPQVRRFLLYALEHEIDMVCPVSRDRAVAGYLCIQAYQDQAGPWVGDCLMNGLQYIWPEMTGTMPRAWRCLQGWHRIHVHGEGGPEAPELLVLMEVQMRAAGSPDEADALALGFDCYLRSMEIFKLRVEDIIFVTNSDGSSEASLRLGVAERGESTKTGTRQGVRVDTPYVFDMLRRRTFGRKKSELLFNTNAARYRSAWDAAARKLGVQVGPPHSVRHSGPSNDAATGYRTIWQIQRRGRWASERSVLRYAKTHSWLEARARVPQHLMEQGSRLLQLRQPRPLVARE